MAMESGSIQMSNSTGTVPSWRVTNAEAQPYSKPAQGENNFHIKYMWDTSSAIDELSSLMLLEAKQSNLWRDFFPLSINLEKSHRISGKAMLQAFPTLPTLCNSPFPPNSSIYCQQHFTLFATCLLETLYQSSGWSTPTCPWIDSRNWRILVGSDQVFTGARICLNRKSIHSFSG